MKKALVIDNHTKHLDSLLSLIPCETQVTDWESFVSLGDTSYDVIILTGGSDMPPVAEYPEAYANERRLIRESTIPLIGICLGCELIAHELGADIEKLNGQKKGFITISVQDAFAHLFPEKNFIAYEAHSRVIKNIPGAVFEIIASSDHGPEIIHHRKRNIWGIQFHPEHLTDRTLGDEVFLTILRKCFGT